MNNEQTTNQADSSVSAKEIPITTDESFSYEGFQVVRGEFFAHTYEPSFTFNSNKVSVNTACIKRLPQTDYVQILVNPDEKKLAVRPCLEDEKDSFRWCSATAKRSPRQITCRIFFAKVISLMGWNSHYRYKLLGKLIRSGDELLFVFDLTTPEIFVKEAKEDGKVKSSRTPSYPKEWQNQFGVPVAEHQSNLQINMFDGYAVFGLNDDKAETAEPTETDNTQPPKEDTNYEQTNLFETNTLY